MSTKRTFWVVWCSVWAVFWVLAGFVTIGLAWILVPASLVMILVPVGSDGPRCVTCRQPAALHRDGRCPAPPAIMWQQPPAQTQERAR